MTYTLNYKNNNNIQNKIDKIILHKKLGVLLFFFIVYIMFVFSINIGGIFQGFFDLITKAMFIEYPKNILNNIHINNIIISITNGFGLGVNMLCTFIPTLFCLFFYLSFLEYSGYLSRAAFLMNNIMNYIGLSGNSFIPIIISFGCNVPAILTTRTLKSKQEKILTIMMTPFMSCSAKLIIYIIFVTAFFQDKSYNIIFILYIVGIINAVITALILKKILKKENKNISLIKLQKYKIPSIKILIKITINKLKIFIIKAGQIIIPLSIIFNILSTIKINNDSNTTVLEYYGKNIVVILDPIGIKEKNWPAAISLISGIISKELIMATLNTLYSQEINYKNNTKKTTSLIKEAFISITENINSLTISMFYPIKIKEEYKINETIIGTIYEKFENKISALSYLIFILLYFPCISVIAVITKEINFKWAIIITLWNTCFAYLNATIFFQFFTFKLHMIKSIIYISVIIITTYILVKKTKSFIKKNIKKNIDIYIK